MSVGVAAVLGLLDAGTALVMLGLSLAVGALLSTTTIAVEEFTFHRYRSGRDLLSLLVAGLLENVGFRQLHAWFRLRGLLAALLRRNPVWTAMPRTGFTSALPLPEPVPTPRSGVRPARGGAAGDHRLGPGDRTRPGGVRA